MKALKFFIIKMLLFSAIAAQAQVSVNVNIGSPPLWGPVGYTEVQYYYLPDVEAYYDVHSSMFIYFAGGAWIHRASLPSRYRSYDLYGGYKVVMTDYRGDAPYTHFKEYKTKYKKGYHGPAQKTIGEKPGKGNSGGKNSGESKHGIKKDDQGKGKSGGQSNKDMKKRHDSGKGKKK